MTVNIVQEGFVAQKQVANVTHWFFNCQTVKKILNIGPLFQLYLHDNLVKGTSFIKWQYSVLVYSFVLHYIRRNKTKLIKHTPVCHFAYA